MVLLLKMDSTMNLNYYYIYEDAGSHSMEGLALVETSDGHFVILVSYGSGADHFQSLMKVSATDGSVIKHVKFRFKNRNRKIIT